VNAVTISDQKSADNVVEIGMGHIDKPNDKWLTSLNQFDRPERAAEQFDLQHLRAAIAVTIHVTQRRHFALRKLIRCGLGWFRAGFVRLLPRHDDLLV